MTRAGERLLIGAEQALAYARGKAKADTFRVHNLEAQLMTPNAERKASDCGLPIKLSKIKANGNNDNEQSTE